MSTHALRKTFGPLSAGTRVNLLSKKDGVATVQMETPPSYYFREIKQDIVEKDTGIFNCPIDMLVELRHRGTS